MCCFSKYVTEWQFNFLTIFNVVVTIVSKKLSQSYKLFMENWPPSNSQEMLPLKRDAIADDQTQTG